MREHAHSRPSESWRIWERAAQIVSADKLFRVQLLYPMTPLTEHKLFSKLPERQQCYTREVRTPCARPRVCEATGGEKRPRERALYIFIRCISSQMLWFPIVTNVLVSPSSRLELGLREHADLRTLSLFFFLRLSLHLWKMRCTKRFL